MDGQETVFWFISDPVCSISRPIKELKFFQKKHIDARGHQVFTFTIDPLKDLSFFNGNGSRILETGEYILHVGNQYISFELH